MLKISVPVPTAPRHPVDHPDPKRAGKVMKRDEMHPDDWNALTQSQQAARAANKQWLADRPANPMNVVAQYDKTTPDQRISGKNWYPGANYTAHILARDANRANGTNYTADQAAGIMAIYSPQTRWHDNIHQASLALQGMIPGGPGWKSPVDGKGFMATGAQAEQARRVLSGEDWRNVVGPLKVGSFGHNIASGGEGAPATGEEVVNNIQVDKPRVTHDRHDVSVMHGDYADEGVYKAAGLQNAATYDSYTGHSVDAVNHINQRDGSNINPASLQAITWLKQQEDNGGNNPSSVAMANMTRERWNDYAATRHPDLLDKVPVVGFAGGGKMALDTGVDMPVSHTWHGMPTFDQSHPYSQEHQAAYPHAGVTPNSWAAPEGQKAQAPPQQMTAFYVRQQPYFVRKLK